MLITTQAIRCKGLLYPCKHYSLFTTLFIAITVYVPLLAQIYSRPRLDTNLKRKTNMSTTTSTEEERDLTTPPVPRVVKNPLPPKDKTTE